MDHHWPVEPLYISHEGYACILDQFVKAGYGNSGFAEANIMKRYDLKKYTTYCIVLPGFEWDGGKKTAVVSKSKGRRWYD